MSATRNNTNKSAASKSVAINKHCAFCFNAGEPEAIYSSHFLRESKDPHSKVLCPLLLNNVCPNCGKKGHTRKECKNKYKNNNKKVSEPLKPTPTKTAKFINCFDALMGSDSEDEEKKQHAPSAFKPVTFSDSFPSLPKAATMAAAAPPKAAAKQCNVAASLKQLYPHITIPTNVPRMVSAPQPMAKIVRPSKIAPEPQAQAQADADYDSDTEISAIYNQVLADFNARPRVCATDEDWAAIDEDSDDEDW